MKPKCEHIEKIQKSFKWMLTEDKKSRLMPHLEISYKDNLRVQFCPVCGVDCRDIKLEIKEL
jgi:hypothetical protein